jgi:hypothetical protein
MKEKNENYLGWSNRETWAVSLNLRESGLGDEIADVGGRIAGSYSDSERNMAIAEFAEYFSELLNDFRDMRSENPEIMRVFDDIGSMWRVDFYELAEAWLE